MGDGRLRAQSRLSCGALLLHRLFAPLLRCLALAATFGVAQALEEPPRVQLEGFGGFAARIYVSAAGDTLADMRKPLHVPVVLFVTGGGAIEPSRHYSKLLGAIANKGLIAVGLDRYFFTGYATAGHELASVMEWAVRPEGLAAVMLKQHLLVAPDAERIALMGHSSGNHIIGEALSSSCGPAKAWIMLDPVDGADPYGIIRSQDLIKPGSKLNFTLPALMVDNGLDPTSVSLPGFPACAPAELSNDRFYNAMRGPIWAVNATAYGHFDCTDTQQRWLCPTDTQSDKDAYRSAVAQAAGTFLGALFDTRPRGALRELEDAYTFGIDVILKHDLKGLTPEQVSPGCSMASEPGHPSAFLV